MKKILIIKLSALGDLFLALPHMETILQHHATDEVHLITSPAFMPLFEHHPRLRVIPLNRKHHFFGHSALARAWWIQRQCFDVVYDLQGNRTSRRLVRFSRAGKRVGTQPNRIYTHHPAAFYRDDSPQSVFDRLNETLVAGGLSSAQTTCTLYPSDAQRRAVARWKLAQQLTDQRYVVLHAGSSRDWPAKRWPEDHFGALADRLTARALRVVWIGGPDDHEINQRLAAGRGIDATMCFSYLQLYELASQALFALTNDSGPMHLFAAAGIRVYALFGPTDWRRSHAAGQRARVIYNPAAQCRPCFSGHCPPRTHHVCLQGVTPEQVMARIENDCQLTKESQKGNP